VNSTFITVLNLSWDWTKLAFLIATLIAFTAKCNPE